MLSKGFIPGSYLMFLSRIGLVQHFRDTFIRILLTRALSDGKR